MSKIKELKELCKKMAHDIRVRNQAFKELQRGKLHLEEFWKLPRASSSEFRHHHIAYCLLRGTPYERIEPKVLPGNEPSTERIEVIKQLYTEVLDVAPVCADPA